MQRPHYWKAILNIALLKDQVSPGTLHQLVMGQFQALRFENIENIDGLHAMRDDIRKRILAATVKDEGESYLIILEVVDNHEYDKSRFLKPGVLKKYLEDNMDTIKAFIKNKNYVEFGIYDLQDIELIFELEPTADSDAKTIASEPRTFLSLIFTAEQREICDNPHYPLVVEGAAGSGKSTIALAKVAEKAGKYVNDPDTTICYVTPTANLATRMHDLWLELPIAKQVRKGQVRFVAYDDLFKTKLEVVGYKHFKKFVEIEKKRFRQRSKNKPTVSKAVELKSAFPRDMPEDFFDKPLYVECRIVSGFATDEEYEKLGENQSLIAKNHRIWFFDFYRRYLEHLGEKYFDYGLCRPPHIGQFDFMFVDEMQNLSYLQLIVLAEHARAGQIGYGGDKDQTLKDLRPSAKSDFLKNWLSNFTKSKVTYAKLTKSHRGSKSVLLGAQCVLDIKALVTKEHKSIIKGDNQQEGSLRICRFLDEKTLKEMHALTQSPTCAVITQKALIEKIQTDLHTPLVFDVDNIIGLEYETVIIDLLDSDIFFEIDKQLQNIKDSCHVTPSDDCGRELQNLYVALTRAILNCIVIVRKPDILHRISNILNRLEAAGTPELNSVKDAPQKTVVPAPTTTPASAPALSPEENERKWRLHITDLLKKDSKEYDSVARAAVKLHLPNEDYESFKAGILGAVSKPVMIEEPRAKNKKKKKKKTTTTPVVEQPAAKSNATLSAAETNQALEIKLGKDEQYIKEILTTPTRDKLEKLCKDKKATTYLFDTLLNDRCLFARLFDNRETRGAFLPVLPNHIDKIATQITANALCSARSPGAAAEANSSPLYWLASFDEGLVLLSRIFKKNKKITSEITGEMLCRTLPESTGRYANTSVLYWLCERPGGSSLLNYLLDSNPQLARQITGELLCLPLDMHQLAANNVKNVSILFWLSAKARMPILVRLLDANPPLAGQITGEALCRSPTMTGKLAGDSALYGFSNYPEGLELLNRLLKNNEQLANEITAEGLCRARPEDAGALGNTSPLYRLCSTSVGLGILDYLLNHNVKLASQIPAKALYRQPSKAAGYHAYYSALFLLCTSDSGCSILKRLLESNSELASQIPANALYATLPSEIGATEHFSALLGLSSNNEGCAMINKFLTSNAKLAGEITAKILCRPMSNKLAGHNKNRSIIYGLSNSQEGIDTLKLLLAANPNLAKEMDAKALCLAITNAAKEEENQSALFWLCGNPAGHAILMQFLIANKKFASEITGAALCRRLPAIAVANAHCSALYFLCGGGIKGHAFLARLLDENPGLARQITSEALCQPVACEGNVKKTALSWLCSSPECLAILERLLVANPSLARGIPAELLCQPFPKVEGGNPNESILYMLCAPKIGQDNLRRMINANLKLAANITCEALCRQSSKQHATALYWLTSSNGIDILHTLFDHNPLLSGQITAEALCHPRPKEAGIFANVSVLYYLSETFAGIAILKRLLDENPGLAAQIDNDALMRTVKFSENASEYSVHSMLSQSEAGRSVLQLLKKANKCIASPVVSRLEAPTALTGNSLFRHTASGSISLVNDNNVITETQRSDCGPDNKG